MGQGLTDRFINKQLKRLQTVPFAPEDQGQIEAFADEAKLILHRYARSEDHCRRIMDVVMERTTRGFPAPGVIAEAAAQVPEFATIQDPQPRCAECGGTGWIVVNRVSDGITGARRCFCYKKSEPRAVISAVQERYNPSRDRDDGEAELAASVVPIKGGAA